MGALDTDKPIPDLVYYRPDGSLLSRIEMEKQTRDIWQKVHWLRIKANKLYDLGKPLAWDMTEVVLRHWILDEMIRRGQVVGNQLGVNVQSYNDEAEKRNFTQRLTALIQAGEALVPQEGEGFDMTNFQQPPPPLVPPGSGGNGSQPQAPGFTPPPPPPQMGMPTMMPPPPSAGGYPQGPPQNYPPPGVGVPTGNYPQQPQAPQAPPQQYQQPAPGYPPVPQQFTQAPQFQAPQMQPPPQMQAPPQQPQFQAPPQPPQQGTIPGAPQMGPGPAPTASGRGRRGRGAASADTQNVGSVPPPPQQAVPVPQMPGYPQQQPQFAPLPPPPQQQPQQFQVPQNTQGGSGELQALNQKIDQLLGMIAQQGQHITLLVQKVELISAVSTISARAVWRRDGSSDAEVFLKEIGRLPQ